MAIQQFDLLKKSAITQIKSDLEGAVEADRLLAQQAAEDSVGAKELSQTAQGLSEGARDKSQQWAENPENVEVEPGKYSALHHAAKAEDSKDLAEKWAEEDEDVEVETGKYSAKHWATKADETVTGKEEIANKQNSLAVDGTGAKYPTVDAVNEGLALKADTVDVMQNKQSIATLESILSDANINQDAQVTTSGVDTVALPKTAANTGMQVQIFGESDENSNVIGTGRVRSVDKNGLNPSALYLTTPPLRSNGLIKDEIRKGTNGYELVKRVGVGTLTEKITNAVDREFSSDTGFWTKATGVLINDAGSGVASGVNVASGLFFIRRDSGFSSNTWKRATFEIKNYSSGGVRIQDGAFTYGGIYNSNGVKTLYYYGVSIRFRLEAVGITTLDIDNISVKEVTVAEALNATSTFTELGSNINYTLNTPVITPVPHAGLINSNSNGTVYFEPAVADAGVYGSNMPIQLTDFPISTMESISKYEDGLFVPLNPATAVIASGGLSFTHPDLTSGDLVTFTYLYDLESTGRSMTLTHYDSRYVVKDTANTDVYKITPKITSGVLTWELTLV